MTFLSRGGDNKRAPGGKEIISAPLATTLQPKQFHRKTFEENKGGRQMTQLKTRKQKWKLVRNATSGPLMNM